MKRDEMEATLVIHGWVVWGLHSGNYIEARHSTWGKVSEWDIRSHSPASGPLEAKEWAEVRPAIFYRLYETIMRLHK